MAGPEKAGWSGSSAPNLGRIGASGQSHPRTLKIYDFRKLSGAILRRQTTFW